MQFSRLVLLALPAISLAAPAVVARQDDTQSSVVIENFVANANSTISQLSILQCNIKGCVEALAPLLAACAIAAATEGRDTAKDATCVADAYQDLSPSKKPAECNHCYK
ncbi:hypothetical protein M409DRAFT_53458 [Zasmidium cellare ATCC 36951]|uniref:Fungal calcium binding protein domain-containing protein n=1 Tax=Zasmidium cellare ATCC 36951 TaxID=1080233 RepID=A0A6A6CPJ2_ZASCE|nr:uncharacterized protein M409DRAFT_53458 [Zasmidium cellare ATCC 36951]KAF2168148.1 hypothetical protein M409DRAFT_53458 [Zasmidium cellare ATCC 36951]